MALLLFLLPILILALLLGAAWWLYRFAFYSPQGDQNNDYHLVQT